MVGKKKQRKNKDVRIRGVVAKEGRRRTKRAGTDFLSEPILAADPEIQSVSRSIGHDLFDRELQELGQSVLVDDSRGKGTERGGEQKDGEMKWMVGFL